MHFARRRCRVARQYVNLAPTSPSATFDCRPGNFTMVVTGLIFVIVEGVLLYSVWRFREPRAKQPGEPPQVYGSKPIEIAWTAAPRWSCSSSCWSRRDPVGGERRRRAATGRQRAVRHGHRPSVVVGIRLRHVRRPDSSAFTTANELHVPASDGRRAPPVYLTLKSADVCHSFWVPRLGGKIDLIPGRINRMWFQTDEPGLYLGQCAEYCGTQHANMLIRVVVESAGGLRALAGEQSRSRRWTIRPCTRGQGGVPGAVVRQLPSRCAARRPRAPTRPDLTHLMSRQTLASGMVAKHAREPAPIGFDDPQNDQAGLPDAGVRTGRDATRTASSRYLLTLR